MSSSDPDDIPCDPMVRAQTVGHLGGEQCFWPAGRHVHQCPGCDTEVAPAMELAFSPARVRFYLQLMLLFSAGRTSERRLTPAGDLSSAVSIWALRPARGSALLRADLGMAGWRPAGLFTVGVGRLPGPRRGSRVVGGTLPRRGRCSQRRVHPLAVCTPILTATPCPRATPSPLSRSCSPSSPSRCSALGRASPAAACHPPCAGRARCSCPTPTPALPAAQAACAAGIFAELTPRCIHRLLEYKRVELPHPIPRRRTAAVAIMCAAGGGPGFRRACADHPCSLFVGRQGDLYVILSTWVGAPRGVACRRAD